MKVKKYDKPVPVYIRWYDHHSFVDQGWHQFDEFVGQAPVDVETLGFLVGETKDQYYVVHNYHRETFSGCMSILKKAVLQFKRFDRG